MNIGIDIRAIGARRTGDETYTLQLVRNLANIDHENSYFLYMDTDDPRDLEIIKGKLGLKNDKFILVPVLPASKSLWTFWSLPRQARKDKLDILHVQYITPIKLASKTKIITTIHDLSFVRHPEFIKKSDLFFLKLLIPPSLKHADRIIAVSNFTKKEIIDCYGIADEKIFSVHNGGADEIFYQTAPPDRMETVSNKIGEHKPYIFYVGTLQPRKNIPLLLKGFEQLKKKHQDSERIKELHLVIAGSRSGRNYDDRIDVQMKNMSKDVSGQVLFTGYIESELMPAYFQSAKLFCFPSVYEGFGLPLIEAMASGIPAVCSDSSCLGEVAKKGVSYFQDGNQDSLVEKLFQMLTSEQMQKEICDEGKKQAREYSWKKCAKETLGVYESVR